MTDLLRKLWLFVRLSRPVFLAGGALLYALGAAIARYAGYSIDPGQYVLGQGLVLCIQLMAQYLNEFFDAAGDSSNQNRTMLSGGSGVLGPEGLQAQTALYAGFASAALGASLTTVMLTRGEVSAVAWLILILAFLGAYAYSAPPVRLVATGYGEIAASLLVAGLVPAFAFSLQAGELHVLLLLACAPLIALHMAMLIALELPDYTADEQSGKGTLAVRLGWRAAMRIHDGAILAAAVSVIAATFAGLPARIVYSLAITSPLAAAQVWQLRRIRRGRVPLWRTLTLGAVALFALAVYFELIGFLFG